jgi:hypothetical protein
MRAFPITLVFAVAACTAPVNAPSLAPRPAEAIDPRVPVPEVTVSPDASVILLQQLERLVTEALAGDEAFQAAASNAERIAASAGPPQSESWIAAQQALSVAVKAREPVATALSEIDGLAAAQVQQHGGLSAADLNAINAASARVAEIDARQAERIEQLRERLSG